MLAGFHMLQLSGPSLMASGDSEGGLNWYLVL